MTGLAAYIQGMICAKKEPASRRFGTLWVLALAWLAGCQPFPEEVSVEDTWTPIVAVPLVDTEFDLGDVLEAVTDSLDTVPVATLSSGELAFVHRESFSGSIAEEWLILPDVSESESVVFDEAVAFGLELLPPGETLTVSDTLSTAYLVDEPEGVLLSEVRFASGTLAFTLSTTTEEYIAGEILLPQLLDPQGMPWSIVWEPNALAMGSFTVEQDLTDWRLVPQNTPLDTNRIDAAFTLFLSNNPFGTAQAGQSLDLALTLNDLTFDRVEGDFGQSLVNLEQSSSTFDLFDDRFTTSGLVLDRTRVELQVTNGFGLEAVLDSLTMISSGMGPDVVLTTDALPFDVASANGSADDPVLSTWVLDETNSNVVDFFSTESRTLDIGLQIRSNPGGLAPGEVNFVDANGAVEADFLAEIPLSLRAEQVDFLDTLSFSLEPEQERQAELDSAELRFIFHNGFPFGVEGQAYFLSPEGVALDSVQLEVFSLLALPVLDDQGLPVEPAVSVTDFFFDWDRADRLRQADRIVIQAFGRTPDASDGTFVRVTEEQGLRMEIGAVLYTHMSL